MSNTLAANFEIIGSGTLTRTLDLSFPVDGVALGSEKFDALTADFTDGTGNQQANEWFHDERTVAGTTHDDLDLAGSLTNAWGETVTFTAVKVLLVAIDAPDGTKVLRVGPQNVTNPWQGPWGGTGATVYETVYDFLFKVNTWGGWGTITAGAADVLGIYNPGADAVTYRIWIIGTK